jgi:hypothetical protein
MSVDPRIQASLASLGSISGFLCASLVELESATMLGANKGTSGFDIELASAMNSDVLRAKLRAAEALGIEEAIEDILITLSRQYHIIRPVRAFRGLFYYLVLDRQHANLALARVALAQAEVVFK